jgi:hypothetical protein
MKKMKNSHFAKLQLYLASELHPNVSQQFCIFRFKRLIEEEYYHVEDETTNIDILSTLTFEQFSKKIKENIEKVGFLYIDFWNAFVQDDMSKYYI